MSTDDPDVMSPSELGNKLVVALRSVSDPQAIMQAIADRTTLNLRNELTTKIEAMDKAVVLWHDDLVRVPTDVQQAVSALRDVLEQIILRTKAEVINELNEEIANNKGLIATLAEVSEERFKSIQTQFLLLKQATEQLDLANKTAIAAALQAQKESAGETQKSSQAAIAKSETSTSEAIKALTTTFNVAIAGLTDRYNDLKGRMDRGEGKTSVSDPAISDGIAQIRAMMTDLSRSRDANVGHSQGVSQSVGLMIALAGLAIAGAVMFTKSIGLH